MAGAPAIAPGIGQQPMDLFAFWRQYPEFVWGPAAVCCCAAAFQRTAAVAAVLEQRGAQPYGAAAAGGYAAFAIVLAYAVHGWVATHAGREQQLQSYDAPPGQPSTYAGKAPSTAPAAVRTVAALATSMVYTVMPLAPATASWGSFVAWTALFAVVLDAWFWLAHKTVHEHGFLYKRIHKLHHTYKQPHVFSAYYVTYQSHFLTEQLAVFAVAYAGLPVDVFTCAMCWGTLGTYVQHCGHDLSGIRLLGPLPLTFGQLLTAMSPWSLVLGGETTEHHDLHHEKFTTNYALSFTYLDRLFGTHQEGRVAGALAADRTGGAAPRKLPTATYTDLISSTAEDWVVQGAAFDKYAADGNIVRNVLGLVENMRGANGEVGAVVDMYEHSLQTATRARRAGADDETVVCALLHDVGEVLSGTNHGEIAAALLRPYITPANHWLLANHEVFQAHFFLDKCGGDKDLRDKIQAYTDQGIVKGHEWYDKCAEFCLEYDQPSFDPQYDTDPMSTFKPLVEAVLSKPPFWWEPADKPEHELDCKARLAFGYSLNARGGR